jgi:hypothetical protein
MAAKVLTIEIMPGAICQLRLAGAGEDTVEVERKSVKEINHLAQSNELQSTLREIIALAQKVEKSLQFESAPSSESYSTRSLFEGDPVLSSKPPKKKRR